MRHQHHPGARLQSGLTPPTFDDVRAAERRLDRVAIRTPVLRSDLLDQRVGGRVVLKAESLQRTGSFKIRGAYNRLARIGGDDAPGGMVAFSSGNHAQGVALAAALLGHRAAIVMPADAPAPKLANTLRLGAEVVSYDRWTEDREAIATELARQRRAVLVPSYDDADVIAGQGTVGVELIEDAGRLGLSLDELYVPASGGGLLAGVGLAVEALSPGTALFAVEPDGHDDHRRSLAAGERLANGASQPSICDALLAATPGKLTFALNQTLASGGCVATDAEVLVAMRFAFETLKLVLEPGGAVALAALLAGRIDARDKIVGLVLSGGNVEPALFARAIAPPA